MLENLAAAPFLFGRLGFNLKQPGAPVLSEAICEIATPTHRQRVAARCFPGNVEGLPCLELFICSNRGDGLNRSDGLKKQVRGTRVGFVLLSRFQDYRKLSCCGPSGALNFGRWPTNFVLLISSPNNTTLFFLKLVQMTSGCIHCKLYPCLKIKN